jgi:hypothetical protein
VPVLAEQLARKQGQLPVPPIDYRMSRLRNSPSISASDIKMNRRTATSTPGTTAPKAFE